MGAWPFELLLLLLLLLLKTKWLGLLQRWHL